MNSTILIEQLKSTDPAKRQEAMTNIGNSFDKELLSPLTALGTPDEPEIELLLIKYLQNLPLELSLPHFLTLSRSPNEGAGNNVLAILDQIDWEQDPEKIKQVLEFNYDPLILFILEKIESSKREILLTIIAPLLINSSPEVAEAVFRLVAGWNFPSAIPLLLPLLKGKEDFRTKLAIVTLGRLASFKKWRRLRPFIKSSDPEFRQAVVQSIRLCGGADAKSFFLKALKKETDANVIKELITALSGVQSSAVIRELIRLAALHAEPGVRKTANWAVNECRGKALQKSIKKMFKPEDEVLCSFLITKIGALQITELGYLVVSFLNENAPVMLRSAALESLALLKDKKYIDKLRPYITSSDSMEAYLGTLAAANTVSFLDECRELKDIFTSTEPEKDVLKQILLELMNGTIRWNPEDETILATLKQNLDSEDDNTRYLSLFLIKQTKDRSFIPVLSRIAESDSDMDVRETALQCIDALLDGDMGYYLDELTACSQGQEHGILDLLIKLSWNKTSALKAIDFFAEERWQNAEEIMQIASAIYPVSPREIEEYVRKQDVKTAWLFALASAWLTSINPLNTDTNKKHWFTLLDKGIPELQALLIQKAIENKSKWAVEPLQHSLDNIKDPAVSGQTKDAVKKLIEL